MTEKAIDDIDYHASDCNKRLGQPCDCGWEKEASGVTKLGDVDVSRVFEVGAPDDESCPVTKCLCGAAYKAWSGPILSIYRDGALAPEPMPCCGRRFYFSNAVRVFEVRD